MEDLSEHTLGETRDTLEPDTAEDHRRLAAALAGQARRGVVVMSRDLDAPVYDDPPFLDALKDLAISHRQARIRVLVRDPRPAVRNGHRLIALAQRLPTYFDIRVPARHHREFNEAFLVVDEAGYVHRKLADRLEGTASFNDPLEARRLLRTFDEMWEVAEPDPNLRRMRL